MTTPDLDLRLDALRGKDAISAAVLDAFATFLGSAPDEALFRMSPLRYAAAQGIAEQEGIDLFLHATHVGILEFAWGVLCPGCLAFLTTSGGLRSLDRKKHCNFCDIDIEGSIDDRVEVAFTVAPTVRRIRFHTPDTLDLHQDGIRLYIAPGVRKVVTAAGLDASRVSASLRGICGDVPVMRLAAAGAQREDVA